MQPGDVLAYYGDLGTGKSAFTRGLASSLGVTEPVTSPTYTIVDEYLSGRLPLFHFDIYRLGSATSCSTSAGRIISRAAASAPWSGAKESYFEPKFKLLFENQQAMLEQLAPKSRLEELEDEVAVLRAAVRQHSTEIAKLKQA